MIVSELIEKLSKCPPDAELRGDGCDCYGDVAGVYIMDDGSVMLARSDGAFTRPSPDGIEVK